MNRIDRLSAILTMLQSAPLVQSKQIIDRFGIGVRTMYRDIRALEEAGIPIAGDSRIGYSLVEGFKLPPLMFTQEEAFAFLAAEKLVDKFTDIGLKESYKGGVDKIKAVMRMTEKEALGKVYERIGNLDFDSPILLDSQNRLQIILDAVSKQMRLQMEYTSHSKEKATDRLVDPIGVFFSMANWYMVAYCSMRNDYRTFKISRIGQLKQTNDPIEKNHPPLDTFLSRLKEQTDLQKVVMEVEADKLAVIDESKYYQGLVQEVRKGEMIELHFMTFSFERLARWYLSYMDIIRIVYPLQLTEIVEKIVLAYNARIENRS